MSIKYRIGSARNMRTGERAYRAVAVVEERIDRKELVRLISQKTTVTSGDVGAVMAELGDLLREHLAKGHPVVLDGIGTFAVTILNHLAESPEMVSPERTVERVRVRFRPAAEIRELEERIHLRLYQPPPLLTPSNGAAPGTGSGSAEEAPPAGEAPEETDAA